ncbi:MAG: methyltransferase domain-containing protein [Anaerolineae bacterium]|nr:class I SAM-dependent methyltransferase [Anaerolineae bacterium]MDW8100801.1 methyltransferase domain-containing protein [Anaerolineae bacterium]
MEPSCYSLLHAVEDEHWWHVGMRRLALEWVTAARPSGGRILILDVGCGTGRLLSDLRQIGEAYGVDCSPLVIELWQANQTSGVLQSWAQRLPFADATFDLVTCLDVLYHREVPDELEVLHEIARVLRPGGALILRVPALPWLHTRRDERFHTQRRYTRSQLSQQVRAAGLIVERLSYANALLLPLAIGQRWLGQRFPQIADAGDQVPPRPLNRVGKAILRGEAWWLRRYNFPWGLSLICRVRKGAERGNDEELRSDNRTTSLPCHPVTSSLVLS